MGPRGSTESSLGHTHRIPNGVHGTVAGAHQPRDTALLVRSPSLGAPAREAGSATPTPASRPRFLGENLAAELDRTLGRTPLGSVPMGSTLSARGQALRFLAFPDPSPLRVQPGLLSP